VCNVRELTSHKVNGLNEQLSVMAYLDEPGPGNARHCYTIGYCDEGGVSPIVDIVFQNGPISETGVNGISNESLLAIIEDRLIAFEAGEYSCRENYMALTKLQEAMMWLKKRTLDRVERGVEGTYHK